jgi:hypothetical protein
MDHAAVHGNCFGDDRVKELGMAGMADGIDATF